MVNGSPLDELKQLDDKQAQIEADRAKVLGKIKATFVEQIDKLVKELNDLGFNFRLVEGSSLRSSTASSGRTGTRTPKDAPCPVCKFKTTPLHDGRSHRTQNEKRPYTDAELAAKGLKKTY